MMPVNDAKTLEFSQNELLLLERVLKHDAPASIFDTLSFSDKEIRALVLKVGHALVNLKGDQPADLCLCERECWFYRESISIFDRVGKGEVAEGYSIKIKLYNAILEFSLERHQEDVPLLGRPIHEEVTYDAPSPSEDKARDPAGDQADS